MVRGSRLSRVSSTKPGWHITSPPSGNPAKELAHQHAEIGRFRKIIGAGKGGIERDAGSRGALAELRAEDVEHQRLGRAEQLCQRLEASALADPGAGRGFLHRAQEGVAHLREELRVLVAVDEIGRAAEQLPEGRELGQKFVFDQAGIEPPQQA